MDVILLHRLGKILYEIYNLHNYNLANMDYNIIQKQILETLEDIRPKVRTKDINPDIKEFVEQTNRRLNNG